VVGAVTACTCILLGIGLLASATTPEIILARREVSAPRFSATTDTSHTVPIPTIPAGSSPHSTWDRDWRWRVRADSLAEGIRIPPRTFARASDAEAGTVPIATPNLWGADGSVLGMAQSGNTLYICGAFRSVGENSGGLVPLDLGAGHMQRPFPKVAGSVYAMVPDGSGGWYIGGEFTAVGGKPRSCLAQIRADGSVTDWNPSVTGSPGYIDLPAVAAMTVSGDRVFVGGGFRAIGGLPHENLGCVDAHTGAVLDWNVDTDPDGWVYALATLDSTVFVGGYFFSLGGQPRSCLGALNALDGAVRPWQADAGGAAYCLLARENTLFVGGEFGEIAGGSRWMLAALNARTAELLPFDARAQGIYLPYAPRPRIEALALVRDTLYLGGTFAQIGGQARSTLAAIDAVSGDALPWSPPAFGPQYAGYPPQTCYALAVSGGTLYVGGSFETVGAVSRPFAAALDRDAGSLTLWNPRPSLPVYVLTTSQDAIHAGGEFGFVGDWKHRAGVAAIDLASGTVKPWNPNPDGTICTAVAVRGDRVFVSGDFASIGGSRQPRSYIAALDTVDGEVTNWNPGANNLATIFLPAGDTLYVGGQFTQLGGLNRNYVASLDARSGAITDWDPDANWPVFALARSGDTMYLGGMFTQVSGQPRQGLAAVDAVVGALMPWDPNMDPGFVNALFVNGNTIYVGGAFGRIGGQPRLGIAALDLVSGDATPWYPQPTAWGVPTEIKAFAMGDSTLYVGGAFAAIGGQPRICLAAVDTATGLATNWDPGLDGYVWSLAAEGSAVYVGGGFRRAGGLPASGLASFAVPPFPPRPPTSLELSQCAPNPVSTSAVIRFGLPSAAAVSLAIYDVQGRRIATPFNHALLDAGQHSVQVHTEGWKPGVYLYRLEAGGRAAARKLLVVR
jgi:hypothetical protein